MSTVNSVNNYSENVRNENGGGAPVDNGGSNDSFMNIFAKLLVSQVQNQNPLDPMDPSQFVSQLAQMSQVEMTGRLLQFADVQVGLALEALMASISGHVGSMVMVETDTVNVFGTGEQIKGSFDLKNGSDNVEVILTDENGKEYKISLGNQSKGPVDFEIDPESLNLPAGEYKIKVDAGNGETPKVQIAGILESVSKDATGKIILQVANVGLVDYANIKKFMNGNGQDVNKPEHKPEHKPEPRKVAA
ncbi:flagellar hook capping FlgD N-terminal domain-containing protein [Chromobacterium amazonense]|uniref:flagellar hook capping FlgD N-terminal domain-containing protein n=1 Tax=Chromobacterium amazonense TaxID=1382803 RepID=UPI0031F71484